MKMEDNYTKHLEEKIHEKLEAGEYHTFLLKNKKEKKEKKEKKDIETKVQVFCFGMSFMMFLAAVIELYCN